MMKKNQAGKLKIIITFSALFLLIAVLLMLIFLDGKKTYTVRFELDGGTLLGGSLEQRVMQGQDAIPPSVVKDGAYLRGWSSSYKRITKDVVIEAVWEYETTAGIIYADSENRNFTEIVGAFPHLRGEIYLGAYYNEMKVLGIRDNVFANQTEITKVYLLDGLYSIGANAFSGCTKLTEIEIPETVIYLGVGAFAGCTALETLTLNEGLLTISAGAFENCTSLTEVVLPESLITIEDGVFKGCENLVIKTTLPQEEWPTGWVDGWYGNATVEIIVDEEDGEEGEDNEDGKENDDKDKDDNKDNKERGRG